MASQDQGIVGRSETSQTLASFWEKSQQDIQDMDHTEFKNQDLPLARIKKIMKLDEDVKMISAEAPVLFAKAAELFISELSLRAWTHTEDNKRRTLQRNDIAMAISKFDQFDFLIDIVPRDELPKPAKRTEETRTPMVPDQVQYFLQVAQQQQAALASQNQAAGQTAQPQTIQLQVLNQQGQIVQQPVQGDTAQQPQIIQLGQQAAQQLQQQQITVGQQQQQQQQQQQSQPQVQQPTMLQQIVTATGEVQTVPIQLTAQQLQSLQQSGALQAASKGQQIVLQTSQQTQGDQQTQQQFSQPMFQIQQVSGQGGQQIFIQQQAADGEQVETSEAS